MPGHLDAVLATVGCELWRGLNHQNNTHVGPRLFIDMDLGGVG